MGEVSGKDVVILRALTEGPALAPSVLSADFSRLCADISLVRDAGCRFIHYDVMDGHFVPNLSIGPVVLDSLRSMSDVIFDVHLMISEPRRYFDDFIAAGAHMISFHYESDPEALEETVDELNAKGIVSGVAINPDVEISVLAPVLGEVDFVLLMSVFPGFAGQKFIPEVMEKVTELDAMRRNRALHFAIEVDGGIGEGNIASVAEAGADLIVAGSAVYGAADPAERVRTFNALLKRA